METVSKQCFIWKDPSSACLLNVRTSLRKDYKVAGIIDEVFCSSSFTLKMEESFPSVQALLLRHCRTLGLLRNLRTTYYSQVDHMLTLRLVMDAICRKSGDGSVLWSDIAHCHTQYAKYCAAGGTTNDPVLLEYQKFLDGNNAVNDWMLSALLDSPKVEALQEHNQNNLLVLGVPTTPQEILLLKLLVGVRQLRLVTVETPLDASLDQLSSDELEEQTIQVSLSETSWKYLEEEGNFPSPGRQNRLASVGKRYAEDVFLSFFRLVVNVRDELALLRALMSPLVNLPQEAFLLLKRTAADKGISICQFAVSYVTRIQLGGQSYAVPNDCPIKAYLSQLSIFSQILDKLQTITEEEMSSRKAIKRMLNYLTNQLLKLSGKTLQSENIRTAADSMTTLLDNIEKSENTDVGLPASEHTIFVIQKLLDHCGSCGRSISLMSNLIETKCGTPIAGPSPFSFFRTPDEVESDGVLSLSQRISADNKSETPVCTKKFKAGLPWGVDPNQLPDLESYKSCLLLDKQTTDQQLSEPKVSTPVREKRRQSTVKRFILGDIMNHQAATSSSQEDTTEASIKKRRKISKLNENENLNNNITGKKKQVLEKRPEEHTSKKTEPIKKWSGTRKTKQKTLLPGQTSIANFFRR